MLAAMEETIREAMDVAAAVVVTTLIVDTQIITEEAAVETVVDLNSMNLASNNLI